MVPAVAAHSSPLPRSRTLSHISLVSLTLHSLHPHRLWRRLSSESSVCRHGRYSNSQREPQLPTYNLQQRNIRSSRKINCVLFILANAFFAITLAIGIIPAGWLARSLTLASLRSHPVSQTVPHVLLTRISTRPSHCVEPPRSLTLVLSAPQTPARDSVRSTRLSNRPHLLPIARIRGRSTLSDASNPAKPPCSVARLPHACVSRGRG